MSRIKSQIPLEFDSESDIEDAAEESYRRSGPARAPYRGRSLSDHVKRLRWNLAQTKLWRKDNGF